MGFLFSACGGGGGNSVDSSNDDESLKAFNQFDTSTFAASTCTNLPIEIPSQLIIK